MSFFRDPDLADVAGDDAEILDAEVVAEDEVPHRPRPANRSAPAPSPPAPGGLQTVTPQSLVRSSVPVAAQAAVVAVTGFAAGAVTAAVVRGASKRRAVKAAKRSPKAGLPVLGTRSFLVDVHLLGPRD